jgi:hypothetical protein
VNASNKAVAQSGRVQRDHHNFPLHYPSAQTPSYSFPYLYLLSFTMFSSFSKLLPQNVSITTPDFLKLNQPSTSSNTATAPSHQSPPRASTNGTRHEKEPESQTTTTAENESLNERERRERPRRRKDHSATEVSTPPTFRKHHTQFYRRAHSRARQTAYHSLYHCTKDPRGIVTVLGAIMVSSH